MVKQEKVKTEEKILEAAKKVFVRKGKAATRMQEIADEAGINKSLLHYYYRSKEKLFGAVFKFAFSRFAPRIIKVLETDKNIFEVLEIFISNYIDLIKKNPFIPMFILGEINKKDASFVTNVMRNSGVNIDFFEKFVEKEKQNGLIKDVDHKQLLINIIALCVFPFIGRPLLEVIIFKDDKNEYDSFLENRKKEITELIINSIKK